MEDRKGESVGMTDETKRPKYLELNLLLRSAYLPYT